MSRWENKMDNNSGENLQIMQATIEANRPYYD